MSDNQLAVVNVSSDFLMPAAPLDVVLAAFQMRKDFIEKVLKLDTDYGIIPGTKKPVLLKPGAEKMTSFFALTPVFEDVQVVEDWTGASHNSEPFFYYRQKCKLYHGERLIATADGSCNSQENKYRFRWVGIEDVPESLKSTKLKTQGGKISEFAFAVEKAETSGKYGKPAEYWKSFQDAIANHTATAITRTTSKGKEMDAWEIGATLYRIPNEEISEVVNTILKMAQKRALIAAVLIATNTSDHFTQDMDDFASQASVEGVWHDVTPEPVKTVDPATGEIKPAAPTPTNGSGHGEQAPATEQEHKPGVVYTGKGVRIGGNQNGHDYPAAWARAVMMNLTKFGITEFEADGILQKLALGQATDPDGVLAAISGYLADKAKAE